MPSTERRAEDAPARAPDYAEPLVGWRVWDVVEADGELRLASLCFRATWLPRLPAVASCRRSAENAAWTALPPHTAPHHRCSCGIYAAASSLRALPYLSRLFRGDPRTLHRVVGPVALWGTVVESTRGWRASNAYPQRIYVPTARQSVRSLLNGMRRPARSVERLAEALISYGVPVEIVDGGTSRELARFLA